MVDLPTLANTVPQVRAPEPRVSAGQVASPYLELADTLATAGREVSKFAERQAEKEGLTAVTRDENGNVKVERPFIVGDAALAYEHGVKVAAVADGENAIKDDMLKLRHKFQLDPEGFRNAAQAYQTEKVAQYQKAAGPEVGVALGKIANSTAREFHEGLLNAKEHRDITNAKASIEIQIEKTKNELFAIASGGDTSSPAYVERLQKIGALQGQLISNPKFGVPKAVAEYNLERIKSELSVASLGHRISEIQRTDGTDAALKAVEQVKTDPTLNLTPTERFGLHSRLLAGVMQQYRAEEAVTKRVAADVDHIGDVAAQGYPVPPAQLAVTRQAVEATGNPALAAKLRDVETVAPIVADWRKASPAQLEQSLASLDKTMRENGATPTLLNLKETGEKLLKNMRDGIKADPLDWANRTGAMPVAPIDWSGADVPGQLRGRASTAEAVARHYGVAPAYFTPDERKAISQVAAQGGAPMLQLASTLTAGFGDKAPKALAEVAKESPVLAHVGGLMASGGSPSLIRDAAEAVALEQNKDFKHPTWLAKESDSIQAAQNDRKVSVYGGAFFLEPDTGRAAEATAQKAFFTRAMRNAYDPKFSAGDFSGAKKAFDRTLQESAGATYDSSGVQYGGVGSYNPGILPWGGRQVLVPSNVRADRFGDVVGALKDDDVAGSRAADGKPYKAVDFQRATPIATRGGYRFALGDPSSDSPKWLTGADGKPFVLDLQKLEPVLRQRVPGAFVGGQAQHFVPQDRPILGQPNAAGSWPRTSVGEGEFQSFGTDVMNARAAEDIRAVLSKYRINPEAFDAWVSSLPESENVEDRRPPRRSGSRP